MYFFVGIAEFAGDMKLRYICFALLTHLVLLLCFCHSLERSNLFGGCQTQWGPPDVLILSPSAISIFLPITFYC